MNTDVEFYLRVANVVLGFLSGSAVLWACFAIRRTRAEALGMVGGAILCFAVGLGTLGILLGFDSIYRLPIITAAMGYVLLGRVAQMVAYRRNDNNDRRN